MSVVQDIKGETNHPLNELKQQDSTKLSAKSFFYTWTLMNFLECLKFSDAKILSPEFKFAGANWRLWLQAVCKNNKLEKIKVRLVKSEISDSEYYIKYKFSLFNANNSSTTKEASSSFRGDLAWGHRLTFKYSEKNKSTSFVIKDKLIVHCKLLVLSSSAGSSDCPIPLHESNSSMSKSSHKLMNLPSLGRVSGGLIQSRPSCKKLKNIRTSIGLHMSDRRQHIQRHHLFKKMINMLLPIFVIYICLMHSSPNKISKNGKLMLNMSEVNALIVDSTLKIKRIAEALNLTDIKVKSSELLSLFNEKYNISDENFVSSKEKKSSSIIADYQTLNVSILNTNERSIINTTTEFIENEG